ncbi:hypothetical protein IGI42_000608 [Enterococcus sp. AZ109]
MRKLYFCVKWTTIAIITAIAVVELLSDIPDSSDN